MLFCGAKSSEGDDQLVEVTHQVFVLFEQPFDLVFLWMITQYAHLSVAIHFERDVMRRVDAGSQEAGKSVQLAGEGYCSRASGPPVERLRRCLAVGRFVVCDFGRPGSDAAWEPLRNDCSF